MKFDSRLVRKAPMTAVFCILLAGCQNGVAQQNVQSNLVTSSSSLQAVGTSEPSVFKQRLEKNREKLRSLREERKEKRRARLEALRNKSEKKAEFASTASIGRESGGTIWDRYKKKNNNPPKKDATVKGVSKDKYGNLIAKYASQHGVPYKLARAVVQVESTFRADVTGAAGEIGLMQIKLATARGMGYKGSRKALYDPATNLYWGMKYLGKAHQLAGGSTCGTILKYNAGHGAKRMNKVSSRYCGRIKRILA